MLEWIFAVDLIRLWNLTVFCEATLHADYNSYYRIDGSNFRNILQWWSAWTSGIFFNFDVVWRNSDTTNLRLFCFWIAIYRFIFFTAKFLFLLLIKTSILLLITRLWSHVTINTQLLKSFTGFKLYFYTGCNHVASMYLVRHTATVIIRNISWIWTKQRKHK